MNFFSKARGTVVCFWHEHRCKLNFFLKFGLCHKSRMSSRIIVIIKIFSIAWQGGNMAASSCKSFVKKLLRKKWSIWNLCSTLCKIYKKTGLYRIEKNPFFINLHNAIFLDGIFNSSAVFKTDIFEYKLQWY